MVEHTTGIKPKAVLENGLQVAIFAGGCFWGVERFFKKEKGVVKTEVGYTGGDKEAPSYEDVCSGKTHHIEALRIEFDPKETSFENLTKLFFEIHDSTQADGQKHDIGEQYKSFIFSLDDTQTKIAEDIKNKVQSLETKPVATQIKPAGIFWRAEEYHQNYLFKRAGGDEYLADRLCASHKRNKIDWASAAAAIQSKPT